jgi:hypothetical protein
MSCGDAIFGTHAFQRRQSQRLAPAVWPVRVNTQSPRSRRRILVHRAHLQEAPPQRPDADDCRVRL